MADLTTRVGNSHALTLTDDDRSWDGDTLEAKLIGPLGEETVIGSAPGQPAGQDTLINLSFDSVDAGLTYQLKVCSPDGIVFPEDGSEYTIKVLEGC